MVGRILVVEDDSSIAFLVGRVLGRLGHDTLWVSNAEEALEALGAGRWDGLVADVHLPGMTGLELASLARSKDQALHIVVMSADRSIDLVEEAHRCGASAWMAKPFSPQELRSCLERLSPKTRPVP